MSLSCVCKCICVAFINMLLLYKCCFYLHVCVPSVHVIVCVCTRVCEALRNRRWSRAESSFGIDPWVLNLRQMNCKNKCENKMLSNFPATAGPIFPTPFRGGRCYCRPYEDRRQTVPIEWKIIQLTPRFSLLKVY